MKKYIVILFLFLLLPIGVIAQEKPTIYLFYSSSCPHCKEEKAYLNELKDVSVKMYEVTEHKENSIWMNNVKKTLGDDHQYVPYTVIGDISITGFNENTKLRIETALEECQKEKCENISQKVKEAGKALTIEKEEEETKKEEEEFELPLLGRVNGKEVSLPIVAIIIGLVDGFNPCAMWVLVFLISLLLGMKNEKRRWMIGITFLTTSAFVYLLFMTAWLKISLTISQITWVRMLIGLVALIGAFVNIKNYITMRKKDIGCTVVDEEKRKKTITKIKKIVNEKSAFLAIIGVITLAFSVNFVELACSAGLPLLFTQILALNKLSILSYAFYMFIYIICYLLDDILIFMIAMITLKITGITNKYTKYTHLIGGIIMLLIGLLMIFKPEILMMNW